jgi:hypothetical protein
MKVISIITHMFSKRSKAFRNYFDTHLSSAEKEERMERAADKAANLEKYLEQDLRKAGISL